MTELIGRMSVTAQDNSLGQALDTTVQTTHVEISISEQQDALQIQVAPGQPWQTLDQGLSRRFAGDAKNFRIRRAYAQSRAAVSAQIVLVPVETVTVIGTTQAGPMGAAGAGFLSGTVDPDDSVGSANDSYLNATTGDFFKRA